MYQDKTGEVDINPSLAIERIDSWVDGAVKIAPNIVVALIVFGLFFLISLGVKRFAVSTFKKRGRPNLGEVLGGFFPVWAVVNNSK